MIQLRSLAFGLLGLWLALCGQPAVAANAQPPLYQLLAQANQAPAQPRHHATHSKGPTRQPASPSYWQHNGGYRATGTASWLATSLDGRRTANGEIMNSHRFTAAHRTLPLGSMVRVTNLANGRQVIVEVNDRGPFNRHLLIDVTRAAAIELGMHRRGTARVRVETVSRATTRAELPQSGRHESASPVRHLKTAAVKGKRIQVASGAHKQKLVTEGQKLQRQLGLPYQVLGKGQHYRLVVGPVEAAMQKAQLRKVQRHGHPQAFFVN